MCSGSFAQLLLAGTLVYMPEVQWVPSEDDETLADLWVDGRITEYDVPEDERDAALDRARIDPTDVAEGQEPA